MSSFVPPSMTNDELEQFLDRVKIWHVNNMTLAHTYFEPEAVAYVQNRGYSFEKDRSGRWRVVKV